MKVQLLFLAALANFTPAAFAESTGEIARNHGYSASPGVYQYELPPAQPQLAPVRPTAKAPTHPVKRKKQR